MSKGNNLKLLGVFLAAAASSGGLAALQLTRAQACATSLAELASERAIRLDAGKTATGLFGAALVDARVAFPEQGLSGVVARVAVDSAGLDPSTATLKGVTLKAKGEPGPIFDGLLQLLRRDLRGWRLLDLTLDYEHPTLGQARFVGVQVTSSDGPTSVWHVAQVELGGSSWSDVQLSFERRPEGIEVGLGAPKLSDAKLRLSQFEARGRSEWTLSAVYQPLPELLARIGWTAPPSLQRTAGVGSISLVYHPGANEPLSGGLRYTADHWPKPDWPEAEELLGRTAAIYAKLLPAAQPLELDAPSVGITTPLFSLKGSGKLALLGPGAHVRFEASGTQDCKRLAAHTPPSRYRDAITAFMSAPVEAGTPEPRLSLELDARGSGEPAAHFAVTVSAGCGLSDAQSP